MPVTHMWLRQCVLMCLRGSCAAILVSSLSHTHTHTHKQPVTKSTPVTSVCLSSCVTQKTDSASVLMEFKDLFHTLIFLKLPRDRVKLRSRLSSTRCSMWSDASARRVEEHQPRPESAWRDAFLDVNVKLCFEREERHLATVNSFVVKLRPQRSQRPGGTGLDRFPERSARHSWVPPQAWTEPNYRGSGGHSVAKNATFSATQKKAEMPRP